MKYLMVSSGTGTYRLDWTVHSYAFTGTGTYRLDWTVHSTDELIYSLLTPTGAEYMAGYSFEEAKRFASKIFLAALNE